MQKNPPPLIFKSRKKVRSRHSDLTMVTNRKLAALLLLLLFQVRAGRTEGHETEPHSRPYMVLLERASVREIKYCVGSLLNKEFVLTAAFCKAESYVVVLGLHKIGQNEGVQRITVKQEFVHPGFNIHTGLYKDLMLLKLSSKATLTYRVLPIVLADRDGGSLPGGCSVAGWGRTAWNSPHMSEKLMEVDVTLINSEFCAQNHFYCSVGRTGPYQGDSGSPLVCENGKIYGLVSHLFKAQNGEAEFRFIKIPDYIDWIDWTMEMDCCLRST